MNRFDLLIGRSRLPLPLLGLLLARTMVALDILDLIRLGRASLLKEAIRDATN